MWQLTFRLRGGSASVCWWLHPNYSSTARRRGVYTTLMALCSAVTSSTYTCASTLKSKDQTCVCARVCKTCESGTHSRPLYVNWGYAANGGYPRMINRQFPLLNGFRPFRSTPWTFATNNFPLIPLEPYCVCRVVWVCLCLNRVKRDISRNTYHQTGKTATTGDIAICTVLDKCPKSTRFTSRVMCSE